LSAAGDAAGAAAVAEAGPGSEPLQDAGVAGLLAGASAEVIPGYTLRLKIGESEKAVVYLAASAHRGHNVALKVSKTLRDEAAGRAPSRAAARARRPACCSDRRIT